MIDNRKPLLTCSSMKRNGEPCSQPPVFGSTICKWHGGTSPFARAMARARIDAALLPAIGVILELALNDLDSNVRLKAAIALLDRGGFGKESKLEVTANAERFAEMSKLSPDEMAVRAQHLLGSIKELTAKDETIIDIQEELGDLQQDEEFQGALKRSKLTHLNASIDNIKDRLESKGTEPPSSVRSPAGKQPYEP